MDLDENEIEEFILDAIELFDKAEDDFLVIEKNSYEIGDRYSFIFNSLHSLKGSLGMFGFIGQMKNIHKLEDEFEKLKGEESLDHIIVDYFLDSLSEIKQTLLDKEEEPRAIKDIPSKGVERKATLEQIAEAVDVVEAIDTSSVNLTKDGVVPETKIPTKCKILIIDDDSLFRDAFQDYFTTQGYEVVDAKDAEEGLNVVKSDKDIHAIFCDYHMPNNNGTYVSDVLHYVGLRVPLLMISADSQRDDLVNILKSNPFTFLEKKEGFSNMLNSLKKALRERSRELMREYYVAK